MNVSASNVFLMQEAIVQDCVSLQFLGEGCWLERREEAKHFNTGAQAIEYCVDHSIKGYQMVLRFDGSFQVVDVPVHGGEMPCF